MGPSHVTDHDQTCEGTALPLGRLADGLLAEARGHHSGRSANTIMTGASMRATVIALTEGTELAEHEAPPAATLQVLAGDVELLAGDDRWALTTGEVIAIPQRRHSLHAGSDAVVLLTVALR
jgi:quercetin dioxygenase-like cupin family protein